MYIKYFKWVFSFLMLLGGNDLMAQVYKLNDEVKDFALTSILNTESKHKSFKDLQKEISIIDFFGTWCAPCIKALPNLENLQKKFPSELAVILISTEKETQLKNFLSKKADLTFPIVVDEAKTISNQFMPPAYPYTVVVNKQNKIIAITEAADIDEEKIKEWILLANDKGVTNFKNNKGENEVVQMMMDNENRFTKLSETLIYAAKTGNDTKGVEAQLKDLNYDSLVTGLANDAQKKAFWINIYNGFTQIILKNNPDKYKKRNQFFKAKQIGIAGKIFSLDQIEHDFLRHTKIKWSLGYFNKIFPGKTAKSLRVDTLDFRLHFALNCGAKSCPPIAFYSATQIDTQLRQATQSYLSGEATYDAEKNVVKLPALMGWFRRDFGGKNNMRKILKDFNIIPQNSKPKIKFKKYSWDLYLDNYKQ